MNTALDIFLTLFHTTFVVFVLTGWSHPKTRRAHIIAVSLTLVAWLGIGLYKGVIGYCPLTDWHWDIKRALGEKGMPNSFIEYILEAIFRVDFNSRLVDTCTALGLVFAVLMTVYKNFRVRKSHPSGSSKQDQSSSII